MQQPHLEVFPSSLSPIALDLLVFRFLPWTSNGGISSSRWFCKPIDQARGDGGQVSRIWNSVGNSGRQKQAEKGGCSAHLQFGRKESREWVISDGNTRGGGRGGEV